MNWARAVLGPLHTRSAQNRCKSSVANVARLHDISTARIYTWQARLRRQITVPRCAEAVVDAGGR